MLQLIKSTGRKLWYRDASVHRSVFGPYKGLRFEVSPILKESRMCVFYTAYEPEVATRLREVVRDGMTIFNIGAHIGIHSLYAARLLRKHGTVYAFEPWPENARALQKNVDLNRGQLCHIEHVPVAVSDTVGVVPFARGITDGTHHLALPDEEAAMYVASTTVDAFCMERRVEPSIMLVDVEGNELAVLKGAAQTIRASRPILILEHHGDSFAASVREWLKEAGYQVTNLGARHFYAQKAG